MITLEEYKEQLINTYRYDIDNTDEKREERIKELAWKYPDEYLARIIDGTTEFLKEMFSSDDIKNGYYLYGIGEDTTAYLSLNIVGGGMQDTVFTDKGGRVISSRILKNIFGNHFHIEVKNDELYEETDEGCITIVGISNTYSLYLSGFPDNMDEIRKQLFGEQYFKKNG